MRRGKPKARCVVIGDVSGACGDEVVAGIGDAGRTNAGLRPAGVTDPGYNLLDDFSQLTDLVQPNECVDLGKRCAQLACKPLRHATTDD